MSIGEIIGYALILVGLLGMLVGSIGLVRLPDFFSRTHAASKVDTVGVIVALIGIAVFAGVTLDSAKVLLAGLFIMLTNPVAAHALGRAAWKRGLKPWQAEEGRDNKEDSKR
ncbi:monovalent cation/H(+) antiporter subunit G [Pelagicoccus sp. SDUM812003]|uniref:monovalent cation/H(+) antiporter subunit G n=1 Tax=Pelagicoccus sp. SDUM812003 TaxID=3041267 RepID=UPI00280EE8A4|nr:monovalent cation/H(+) antiporter subunit G [Pelagicoccus sp. SDUM812003]MDQ8202067.1 monovalent cation/H(+) antiporter subunit G [Pelagicoccus sp. SDUM812003]